MLSRRDCQLVSIPVGTPVCDDRDVLRTGYAHDHTTVKHWNKGVCCAWIKPPVRALG